jgi:putative FmdB family regulatory protein
MGPRAREECPLPRYDYRCEGGHTYELQQPFGSPSEHPCQRCGKTARRLIHARPLVFKGSGWYKTDSRNGSNGDSGTRSSAPSSSARSSTPPKKAEQRAEASDRVSKAAADD